MSSATIRVDSEVLERLYEGSQGKTPNQVLRQFLGLPQTKFPKGGASRRPLKRNPIPHIFKAEMLILKAFHELKKAGEQ